MGEIKRANGFTTQLIDNTFSHTDSMRFRTQFTSSAASQLSIQIIRLRIVMMKFHIWIFWIKIHAYIGIVKEKNWKFESINFVLNCNVLLLWLLDSSHVLYSVVIHQMTFSQFRFHGISERCHLCINTLYGTDSREKIQLLPKSQ